MRHMTTLPALFAGAFLAHHRFVKRQKIDEIYSKIDDKSELVSVLATMYSEVLEKFIDELTGTGNGLKWQRS